MEGLFLKGLEQGNARRLVEVHSITYLPLYYVTIMRTFNEPEGLAYARRPERHNSIIWVPRESNSTTY